MKNMKSFNVLYDRDSDVLYINTANVPAARGEEQDPGLLWRYAGDGRLIGVTIMDFHDLWQEQGRLSELASEISRRFDMTTQSVEVVLEHALD